MQFPYAQWCVLVQSVAAAQVEVCRLRAQFEQSIKAVEQGPEDDREHAYKFFGDLLVGMPDRMRALEGAVQRAAFLLAVAGPDTLRRTMPISDVSMVEETLEGRAASAHSLSAAGVFGSRAGVLLVLRGRAARLPAGKSWKMPADVRARAAARLLPQARDAVRRAGGSLSRGVSWEVCPVLGPQRCACVRLWGLDARE